MRISMLSLFLLGTPLQSKAAEKEYIVKDEDDYCVIDIKKEYTGDSDDEFIDFGSTDSKTEHNHTPISQTEILLAVKSNHLDVPTIEEATEDSHTSAPQAEMPLTANSQQKECWDLIVYTPPPLDLIAIHFISLRLRKPKFRSMIKIGV